MSLDCTPAARCLEFSPQTDQIVPALLAIQMLLKPVAKTGENPHFKSKYATLDKIMAEVLPVAHASGCLVIWSPGVAFDDGSIPVECRIVHESGQWVSGQMHVMLSKPNAHGQGAGITYGRRFLVSCLLGICTEVDDDGNGAAGKSGKEPGAGEQSGDDLDGLLE